MGSIFEKRTQDPCVYLTLFPMLDDVADRSCRFAGSDESGPNWGGNPSYSGWGMGQRLRSAGFIRRLSRRPAGDQAWIFGELEFRRIHRPDWARICSEASNQLARTGSRDRLRRHLEDFQSEGKLPDCSSCAWRVDTI